MKNRQNTNVPKHTISVKTSGKTQGSANIPTYRRPSSPPKPNPQPSTESSQSNLEINYNYKD